MKRTAGGVANDRKRKAAIDEGGTDAEAKPGKEMKATTANSLKSGEPLIQALDEACKANERAILLTEDRLFKINQEYYAGVAITHDQQLEDACARMKASSTRMGALMADISTKPDSAPIYKLAKEFLLHVFSYLDSDGLFACQETCQNWRQILASNDGKREVWTGTRAMLHASVANVDRKWARMSQSPLQKTSLSVKLWLPGKLQDQPIDWEVGDLKFVRQFPLDCLHTFIYEGSINAQEYPIWNKLAQCHKLKTLHWTSHGHDNRAEYDEEMSTADYTLRNVMCKIEEFSFGCDMSVRVDKGLLDMLRQVKRFRIQGGLAQKHVEAIFSAAEESMEEVTILELNEYGDFCGAQPQSVNQIPCMNKLVSFSILDGALHPTTIIAPKAQEVRFDQGAAVDWILLDSCRNSLKILRIETQGDKTTGRFAQEIFDLPQLEALHLDDSFEYRSSHSLVADYKDHSAAAFWELHIDNNEAKARAVLPKLKTLSIIHDPMLDQKTLIRFMKVRALAGHPGIGKAKVHLANHCSVNTGELEILKNVLMPGLKFKTFDDWKGPKTMQWSLTTTLEYDTNKCVVWNQVNYCRGILKVLRLCLFDSDCEPLQKEVFNMPQLEELVMYFCNPSEERNERSAVALWRAVSTDRDAGSKHQDILPRLERLMIINDALLNEDIIAKLIDFRKSHGLSTLQEMIIYLSRKCSRDWEKLDDLTQTVSGFSYERYEDWSRRYYGFSSMKFAREL